MTAGNQQIVSAFEDLQMTPAEIAEDQDLELSAVHAVLLQFSSVFRKANGKTVAEEFTDEEHQMARDVIVTTARYSEDERLRLKAAAYIRDDKKGRLDAIKNSFGAVNFNVLSFNEIMRKAVNAKNKAKGIIDVPTGDKVETPSAV